MYPIQFWPVDTTISTSTLSNVNAKLDEFAEIRITISFQSLQWLTLYTYDEYLRHVSEK